MGNLSLNFSIQELLCKCGRPICDGWAASDGIPHAVLQANLSRLVRMLLQPLRDRVGEPLLVTSGLRCRTHNAVIGGVPHSLHCQGLAADVATRTHSPRAVANTAENLPGIGGIGTYCSWTHIDLGDPGRRWTG